MSNGEIAGSGETAQPEAKVAPSGFFARWDRRLDAMLRPVHQLIDQHPLAYARLKAVGILLGSIVRVPVSALIFVSAAVGLSILGTFYFSPRIDEYTLPRGNLQGLAFIGLGVWALLRLVIAFNRDPDQSLFNRIRRTWKGEKRISYWRDRDAQSSDLSHEGN